MLHAHNYKALLWIAFGCTNWICRARTHQQADYERQQHHFGRLVTHGSTPCKNSLPWLSGLTPFHVPNAIQAKIASSEYCQRKQSATCQPVPSLRLSQSYEIQSIG